MTSERLPAYTIMRRVVERVPELKTFYFTGNAVVFTLKQTVVYEGREIDGYLIHEVCEGAWMRVSDVDDAVKQIRQWLDTVEDQHDTD